MTHRTCIPLSPACAKEFEETRPALYYAADRWGHLPDSRQRDRRAANDAARPVAAAPAATGSGQTQRTERRAGWRPLGVLSAVAVTTVALLGAASAALDAEPAGPRQAVRVASASQ